MAHFEITVHGTEVTLNGQRVDVPVGSDPHTAAVHAAKELAEAQVPAGEVVEVTAHTDQGVFALAIVDGVAMAVGEPQEVAPGRPDQAAPSQQPAQPETAAAGPRPAVSSTSTDPSTEPRQGASPARGASEALTPPEEQEQGTSQPLARDQPTANADASALQASPYGSWESADSVAAAGSQHSSDGAGGWANFPGSHSAAQHAPTGEARSTDPSAPPVANQPDSAHPSGQPAQEQQPPVSQDPTWAANHPGTPASVSANDLRNAPPRGGMPVTHAAPSAQPGSAGAEAGQGTPARPINPFSHTFIEKHRVEKAAEPKPVSGFATVLAQFGIGGPSQAQQAEEADKIAVSRVWTRPKGIAVANGKGGSGKTPTSLYLAAMFARLGGGMVLVDDNNTFRGAAGWQTENATHGATKEDLLAALPTFDGSERAADMARFTHHQTTDRYDVLQSRPQKLARDQALDDVEFDAIQELLRRFYRVVVFDSGNDESAPNWLRMIHHSDALVVPTATSPKHCESAKLLLEALTAAGGHGAELARNAVIVVTHASTNDPAPEQIAPLFAGMAREVLSIPHDPAIAREWLRWNDLAPKTQRAWLAVGAAVARGMED